MAATMEAEERQLIFIPGPGMGHLLPAVEVGKLILSRHTPISITYLLITDPQIPKHTHESLQSNASPRLRFLSLPNVETQSSSSSGGASKPLPMRASEHINRHVSEVREAVFGIVKNEESHVAGLVIDMFCVNMIDVADELGIPAYVFYTSSAAFLSFKMFFQCLSDDHGQDITQYEDSDQEFLIPGFVNPVPARVMPSMMLDKNGGSELVVSGARKIRRAKGIFINTFQELDSTAIKSLSDSTGKIPPIFPIGPVIKLDVKSEDSDGSIIRWLDKQPSSSVVFLCFGSQGTFSEAQIKHLATALESSGHRFLWSLRRRDEACPDEILPAGFLERTRGVGRVIGWAPQAAVLSHPAVGGFVSHCGWNSVLESLCFGVPIAAWPMTAEQQVNAFHMVVELGLAVEIKMDYRADEADNEKTEAVVGAEEIETAINQLMMDREASGMRKKVEDMREKSSRALMEDGSSHKSLGRLIHRILHR